MRGVMKNILNEKQIDALKEIVSIGAGNAATALSQITKTKTSITVPAVQFLPVADAPKLLGPLETMVTSVYLQLLGDLTGVLLFIYKNDAASKLSNLLGTANKVKQSGIDESALKESSTILTGAYLNAISKLLYKKLLMSAPAIAHDMSGAIIENVLIEANKDADFAIIIETEFTVVNEKIEAFFFFIPEKKSLQALLEAMGV